VAPTSSRDAGTSREDERTWATVSQAACTVCRGRGERALLNILEDFVDEQARIRDAQHAVLNILEDLDLEKAKIDGANIILRTEVTERKRTERILQQRTDDLASSNEDLEQFAYVASHDLSEPLRAISGPISLLARRYEGQLDDEADEYIGFAVDGCTRMQAIIDGLLAYSRVGRLEGTLSPVDCNLVATAAVAGLASVITETGAEVSVGELPTVRSEATQLSLVFQNLISNAVKFMAPGVRPHIVVGAERAGNRWRFSVTDNGIGIEPQHRDRIFGMFKRLHGREDYPGTGIGLALVKKIVERHGGTVGIDAGPEGGSRFWFALDVENDVTQ
jgi:light-regulated signal transduction histidine kinase (bacteriophytochrome)